MFRFTTLTIVTALAAMACGSQPKPVATTGGTDQPATTQSAQGGAKDDSTSSGNLNISEDIRKACNIPETTPFFAYNSAHLRGKDHPVLGQLAQCFSTGALKGRTMGLVGHADPRGEHEYNLVLGERRAAGVKGFLTGKGLDKAKVQTSSRGFMDASGSDEKGWARDRRVDVLLAD